MDNIITDKRTHRKFWLNEFRLNTFVNETGFWYKKFLKINLMSFANKNIKSIFNN